MTQRFGVEGGLVVANTTYRHGLGYSPRRHCNGTVKRPIALMIAFSLTIAHAQHHPSDPTLWYQAPAAIWTEALPVGNGRLGAMDFGGGNPPSNNGDTEDASKNASIANGTHTRAQDEHLQLNESSIWQGDRHDVLNPKANEGFKRARSLLISSKGIDGAKIAEAEQVANDTMLSSPRGMPGYSTLGDVYLRANSTEQTTQYRRELNLFTGVVSTAYTSGGVHYSREVFASSSANVIILHLSADKPGQLSFDVSMDRPADFATQILANHDLVLTPGANHKDAIHFQAEMRIVMSGGHMSTSGATINVSSADEVTFFITAATDFKGGPFLGGDPAKLCTQTLDAAVKEGLQQLREAATADQRRWMARVSLTLGSPDQTLDALPTDERLRRVSAGKEDLGLQSLYFQYGRYLLLASSRPGGLPANLQGIWAGSISNPWGSKWTINVNTEMNYWLSESANLGELQEPLFNLLDMVRTPNSGTGTEVASKYYGARGFVIHHNTDIWGDAHPIDVVYSGIWPMGGAWLTLHAWDHFAFGGDKGFLRDRAWPLMHDASLFFLDYLIDDGTGHLVTGPSLSPENKYKLADGSTHSLTMGPTMDIEIVRELFERTIQASEILEVDPEFRDRIKVAMSKLPPFKIGRLGNLQEWQTDYAESSVGHRHISHL